MDTTKASEPWTREAMMNHPQNGLEGWAKEAIEILEQALAYAEAMRKHGMGETFITRNGCHGDYVLAGLRDALAWKQAKEAKDPVAMRLLEHARVLGCPHSAAVRLSGGAWWLVLNPGGSPETWKRLGSTEYEASTALPGLLGAGPSEAEPEAPAGAQSGAFGDLSGDALGYEAEAKWEAECNRREAEVPGED